jgi:hypothetical protein
MSVTIKDMCAVQAERERERYEAKMAGYVWSSVKVQYCADQKEWIVYGVLNKRNPINDGESRREILASSRLRAFAIADAKLYAFDTSCGPMRAPWIDLYRKDGVWIDAIHPA